MLHQFTGIGDLIWHVQYFKAVARHSHAGKVTVIAQPSTMARAILGHEPWVEEIIDHDHRPRRHDARNGRHSGLLGMWRMAQELKARHLDRLVLFSGRPSRGLLARMSGIPVRLGYGYHWFQRVFLTQGPYIERYRGQAVSVLKETSAFAMAHGWCSAPLRPHIEVPETEMARMRERLQVLTQPAVALAIGTSEPHKQWGEQNFATLASRLIDMGYGIVILGGKSEQAMAQAIASTVTSHRSHAPLQVITDTSIMGSAAAIRLCNACVGNDTGMVNVSAAVGRPTVVLLGPRPELDHDPLLVSVRDHSLHSIQVDTVLNTLARAFAQQDKTWTRTTHPSEGDCTP